jgi:hypothetical protein
LVAEHCFWHRVGEEARCWHRKSDIDEMRHDFWDKKTLSAKIRAMRKTLEHYKETGFMPVMQGLFSLSECGTMRQYRRKILFVRG